MGLGQNDDPGSEPNTVHRDQFSPYCHKVRAGEQGVSAVILTTPTRGQVRGAFGCSPKCFSGSDNADFHGKKCGF